MASLCLLGVLLLVTAFGNYIMPYDPLEMDFSVVGGGKPSPPTSRHLLGTDNYGRDTLSRLISGARVSITVGLVATGIAIVFGVALGALAGYSGGAIDMLIMRVTDVFLSLPSIFLVMTVSAYLKPHPYNVVWVMGLFGWMGTARLVRAEFLRLREMDFIQAARAIGVSPHRMIVRHLLVNSMAPIIVSATLRVPFAILTESALSYLGLGVPPPYASWGSMLNHAKPFITTAWWLWIPPGIAISLTVFAFNFVGDGLRDAFDPVQHR